MRGTRPNTKRRMAQILAFIKAYHTQNGYPPSMREIGKHIGVTSTSYVIFLLDKLEKSGTIRRNAGVARSIVIAEER